MKRFYWRARIFRRRHAKRRATLIEHIETTACAIRPAVIHSHSFSLARSRRHQRPTFAERSLSFCDELSTVARRHAVKYTNVAERNRRQQTVG